MLSRETRRYGNSFLRTTQMIREVAGGNIGTKKNWKGVKADQTTLSSLAPANLFRVKTEPME
jgi:hypothetical protein